MDNGDVVPIYDIPKTQSKVYIDRLVENGFSVAISDEVNGQRHDRVRSPENVEKPSTSPIWDEYKDIKRIYKDDIILYQVGDFFEIMGDDARTVADKFDLVLTGRDVGYTDRIAMCGFPVRSKEKYIKGLNELGYAVVVSSLDNGVRREDSYLPDKKPTDKMPVGVIDYLANDGTVGYSQEFYDEKEFVDEINDNSYAGVPTSVKVFSNPDTNEHISTSLRVLRTELKQSVLLNISDAELDYITNAKAGHGLIKIGSSLVPFENDFPKNTKLYKLMSTKPGEDEGMAA